MLWFAVWYENNYDHDINLFNIIIVFRRLPNKDLFLILFYKKEHLIYIKKGINSFKFTSDILYNILANSLWMHHLNFI